MNNQPWQSKSWWSVENLFCGVFMVILIVMIVGLLIKG